MEQPGPHPAAWRVKLYKLDKEGTWIDRGTGHISVSYLEQSEAMGLIVLSEDDQKPLLVHKLASEDIYQRQGEATILTWHDKELMTEVAVSFEKQVGCDQVWMQIKQAQEATTKDGDTHEEEFEAVTDFAGYEELALPPPEVGNLEELAKAVCLIQNPTQRERIAQCMLRNGWIPALLDVFRQCEDLEDVGSLHHVFRIVRGAIMLNDAALLEELLKEEFMADVVGALEHDPDMPAPQKHREFLASQVVFKEVVPIKDPALLAKIHQTYRIQYIKDVILPRSLDDATYATLSSLALFNNVEVVSALAGDPQFLHQLFVELDKTDPGGEAWADLVAFLQEFCNLARHLPQQARQQLFGKLVQLGLFEQVTAIMRSGNDTSKLRATDVLLSVMQHDTHALREFLQKQKDHLLFSLLVRELVESPAGDGGLCEQVAELLKLLLDPESLKEKPEKSDFVDLFYSMFMERLLDVITQDKDINPKEGTRHVPANTLSLVVDFMCFCLQNHAFRIKYFTLRKNMLSKVLYVLRRPERWLACAGVRFLKTVVATKEPFFLHQLIKNNLYEPVLSCFFQNGDRYNLLNSAVLELVEFITKENLKETIKHLVDQYSHRFAEVDYVDTFIKLRQRHEQLSEDPDALMGPAAAGQPDESSRHNPDSSSSGSGEGGPLAGRTFKFDNGELVGQVGRPRPGGPRRRWDSRGLSRDEEDYFEKDDDDGSVPTGSMTAGSQAEEQAAADTGGRLLSPDGPYPRPRRPVSGPDSPPSSPKRGRPIQFTSGPNAKRRAGTGPILTIAAPIALRGQLQGQEGLPGVVGHSGGPMEVVQAPSSQQQQPTGGMTWQGLTEYEDMDEQQQQQQQQQQDQQQQPMQVHVQPPVPDQEMPGPDSGPAVPLPASQPGHPPVHELGGDARSVER